MCTRKASDFPGVQAIAISQMRSVREANDMAKVRDSFGDVGCFLTFLAGLRCELPSEKHASNAEQHIEGRVLKTTCPEMERLFTGIVTTFTVRILCEDRRKKNNKHLTVMSIVCNEMLLTATRLYILK